jgi:hypothetical protein
LNLNINGFNVYSKWRMTDPLKGQWLLDIKEGEAREARSRNGLTFEAGTGISAYTLR